VAKRQTNWVDSLVTMVIANNAQGALNLSAGVPTGGVARGASCIRCIYDLSFLSETVAGAWGAANDDYGIGVESEEAFNAGTHPDPNAPSDHPIRGWLVRGRAVSSQNGTGTPVTTRHFGDIRSARKMENGFLVLVVNHNIILGTSYSVRVTGLVRSLILWA